MEISNELLLFIAVLLGLGALYFAMNCTFACGSKEKFFGDQINDPYAVDYASYPSVDNPNNLRDRHIKRHVPVSQATPEYEYQGLFGYGCPEHHHAAKLN